MKTHSLWVHSPEASIGLDVAGLGEAGPGSPTPATGPAHFNVSRLAPRIFTSFLALAALAFAGCSTAPSVAPVADLAVAPPPAEGKSNFEIPAMDDGLPGTGPIRRYDWFRKLWTERRTAWAADVARDQGALVFLGDSITQGWKADLGGSFAGVKVANRGISGDTTRGVLLRLNEDVLSLHPSGVVMLIGTNDLEENAEPWTAAANVRLIIDALRAADPKMPVVLCQVFPSSDTKHRPANRIQRINQLLKEVVRDQPQVTLLDTWTLFANAEGDAKVEEFPDLLHPNGVGYAKWAAALRPVLATLGFLETEPDDFVPEAGFTSLFNGLDLTGWGYRPSTAADVTSATKAMHDPAGPAWPINVQPVQFDGQLVTPDGRFAVRSGRLVVTTPPEYRKIQQLWTTQEFPKNFVLKLEFRATPNADSGIYVRGPQLQCRDYPLAGPYKNLQRYQAQAWNEVVITVKDGVARCTCNGEVLEAAMPVPATGPLGVEGDRGQMEYRRIRLQELP